MSIIVPAVLLGLIVGSFLNVVVYRLPRGEGLLRPGSRCPVCKIPIKAYDNIPIWSFLWLKGRCRACEARISWRYPLVEALTALLFVFVLGRFGISVRSLFLLLFLSALVVVTFIDFEHQMIPHAITLVGIPLGLLGSVVTQEPPFPDALVGAFAGAGLLYLVAVYGEVLLKRECMGGGDVNLLGMIGAFLGLKKMLLALFFGAMLGSVIGLALLGGRMSAVGGRNVSFSLHHPPSDTPFEGTRIPFGPFLAGGAAVALFFGEDLIRWYFSLLR
ncbi:MAG: prepilin peptidase [Candidatus Methylomirabilales bacterium]